MTRLGVMLGSFVLLCFGALGCEPDEEEPEEQLQVLAAASFTEALAELGRVFEAENPHVDVRLTFAGSQVLRLQIEQGAAADVFVSANEQHVSGLRQGGHVAASQLLAENELVVITQADGSTDLEDFSDLHRAERLVVGTPEVPIGRYADKLLERAEREIGASFAKSVRADIVSRESNARLVRAKVELGEADAAIVYRTDAVASERVRMIDVPEWAVRARAHIVTVRRPAPSQWADEFVDFALSKRGQAILTRHGFTPGAP